MLKGRLLAFYTLLTTALIIYMPLHVFIVQSASLVTGGLEVWKAAKDVLVFFALPALLYAVVKNRLYRDKTFRLLLILGTAYGLLHGLFLVFSRSDDTHSTLVASVYNTRILIFFLLGYVVAVGDSKKRYLKLLFTTTVIVASLVSLFAVAQYFLPKDLLSHVGYSIERGVKPMFFIDDKPELPRVMGTLKDPNSLGAYLIVPLLLTGYAAVSKKVNKELFTRQFRQGTLWVMLGLQTTALVLTFSRGALLATALSAVTLLSIVNGKDALLLIKKHILFFAAFLLLGISTSSVLWNSYTFQNVVFHADKSTILEDPNELRVSLTKKALQDIGDKPLGHGPGTAGLVAITNPKGGVLTENYYIQVAYEVGLIGLVLFLIMIGTIMLRVYAYANSGNSYLAAVIFAAGAGYLLQSLLIHLWSNEAVAYQWWLLSGLVLGGLMTTNKKGSKSS